MRNDVAVIASAGIFEKRAASIDALMTIDPIVVWVPSAETATTVTGDSIGFMSNVRMKTSLVSSLTCTLAIPEMEASSLRR